LELIDLNKLNEPWQDKHGLNEPSSLRRLAHDVQSQN